MSSWPLVLVHVGTKILLIVLGDEIFVTRTLKLPVFESILETAKDPDILLSGN